MALIECIECKHQISDQANSCTSCGFPTDKDQASFLENKNTIGFNNKKQTHKIDIKIILSLLSLSFLALLAYNGVQHPSKPKNQKISSETQKKLDFYNAVKEEISSSLKAPSTAEFKPFNEEEVIEFDPGVLEVIIYVDAENSFGAKIRNEYMCKGSQKNVVCEAWN